MARGRSAPRDQRAQALVNPELSSSALNTSESSSSKFPALTAEVAPARNLQEFPSLPTRTQSEAAVQKVMAKKNKKKAKRKKKGADLVSESSQSSGDLFGNAPAETPPETQQKRTIRPDSPFLGNITQQGSEEAQKYDSDEAASVTDEDITPKASMLNLAAASASQRSSTPTPPSANAGNLPNISSPPPVTAPAQPWVYKFDTIEGPRKIVCSKPGCDTTTSPWDGSTVICPSCGPYSTIRYCCIEHLLSDTTDHWHMDCMRFTCHHLCDASTIHPRQVQCPPAIPNLCGWNTPERHRQAVYHAHSTKKNGWAEVDGDYFIFTDAEEWIQAGSPDMGTWALHRARGAVFIVVAFDDDRSPNSLKDRFNRLLNIALFTGASNAAVLDHLFLMIRENLISKGEWVGNILDSIIYQFQWEFCYQVPEWVTNNLRHACPHQWFGTPIDQCSNRICNRHMLQPGSRHPLSPRISIKEKAEELERRYWILRVARVYHPNIQDPAMRMKGVGFEFVRPDNRRMFCMGREWEGYPSGTMEIEDAIWSRTAGGPPCLRVANLMTLSV